MILSAITPKKPKITKKYSEIKERKIEATMDFFQKNDRIFCR
jgi:hypothetical protein